MIFANLKKKQLNIIAIISATVATLSLISVLTIPSMLKTKKTNDFSAKTAPAMDNTNLWATFPGQLHTSIVHNYSILEYTKSSNAEDSYQYSIKKNFSISENVSYENFKESKEDNAIYFDANRKYTYLEDKNDEKVEVNSINMGLFETLETLSYPPLYKVGINSIEYLLKKVLNDPDYFIRKLFAYKIFNEVISANKTFVNQTILGKISAEKAEKILSSDEKYYKYSFTNYGGFFQWVKILGLKEKIAQTSWLFAVFDLTNDEIDSILGEDGYLFKEYQLYNIQLSKDFSCKNANKCDIELVYMQLINGSVIQTLKPEVKDYLSLSKILEANDYPFEQSPELSLYFDEEYKKKIHSDNPKYTDYSPSVEQLKDLLDPSSGNCLLSPSNSINFIHYNRTHDNKKIFNLKDDMTLNTIHFVSDYLYEFLPSIFLYPQISTTSSKDKDEISDTIKIEPISKTYSSMTQSIVDKTYKLINQKANLYDYILSKIALNKLKEVVGWEQPDEICPLIMQKVLDDGKKVLSICSNPKLSFDSEQSLIKWIEPYYCFQNQNKNEDDSRCNMTLINYLKDQVYISDNEIKAIYSEDYLGGSANYAIEQIKSAYNCGDKCNTNNYFNKLQFWTGNITLNAPSPFNKTKTISDWFPEEIPYPVELSYYKEKYGYSEEITEDQVDYLIKFMSVSSDLLDIENNEVLLSKMDLEKNYSLYMNDKSLQEKKQIFKLIDFLINVFVFKANSDILFVKYSSIKDLIQGNSDEDKEWISYLSSGNYFDNFKPKINKTTGIDLGVDLDTKEQVNFKFDKNGIVLKSTKDNYDLRKIMSMNDLSTLNIRKTEYDYLTDSYKEILSPTFDFETLLGLRFFADGFQYDHKLKVIYYYDIISYSPLRFIFSVNQYYNEKIKCLRYDLDVNELHANLNEPFDKALNEPLLTQKSNKPFTISVDYEQLNVEENEDKKKNYVCVDPITNMVVDSQISFAYSIYTRKYGFINEAIENGKKYPVFTYSRNYGVDVDSYEKMFPGVTEIYSFSTAFIIIGIIVFLISGIIAFYAFFLLYKKAKEERDEKNLIPQGEKITESGAQSSRPTETH